MKVTVRFLLATLVLFSGLTFAADEPPGIDDLMRNWDPTNTGGTALEVAEQKLERERLEEAALALKRWWHSQQRKEQPIPYLKHEGKNVSIPAEFLEYYANAKKKNQQRKAWRDVEQYIKKGVFKK